MKGIVMGKSLEQQPLNVLERGDLRKHETTIERGQKTFLEVGNALAAIRDGKLYRESHKTFEAYCKARWTFTRQRASQLIEAADVTSKMSTTVDKPATERQARELGKVPAEHRQEVFEAAVEATDGRPTASAIREAAAEKMSTTVDKPATVEDRMKSANAALDALARKLTALIGEAEEIDNPHLTDERCGRIETFRAHIKTAASTIRSAKGAGVCPYCGGKWCKHCLKTGWVTKTTLESAPDKIA